MNTGRRRGALKRALAMLCAIVVFLTCTPFDFSAFADARVAYCGHEDHEHIPDCYDESGALTCEKHVHTDACYEQPDAKDEAQPEEAEDAAQDEGTVSDEGEVSVEIEVSDDGEPAEDPVDVPEPDSGEEMDLPLEDGDEPDGEPEEGRELTFEMGDRRVVLLSEILNHLSLHPEHIASVGQILYAAGDRSQVEVVQTESDFEIVPLCAFAEVDLAIVTHDDVITVKLVNAHPSGEGTEETVDAQEGAPEAGTEEALAEADEAVEEESPTDENEAPVDEESPADENEAPVDEESPADESETVEEESPADEDGAVEEEAPADENEAPVDEESPADEGEAVEEEAPVDEGEAVEEEAPADEGEETEEAAPEEEGMVTYTYTFEKQKSVFLTGLLASTGLVVEGKLTAVTSSDPDTVQVRGPYALFGYVVTARASFDTVTLSVTAGTETFDILLSNPEAGERMVPGDELVTDDGKVRVVFAEEVVLPAGTELTVTEGEPDLDGRTWNEIDRKLGQAQGEAEADLRWFDISLGDVHEVRATVTLSDAANPGDDVLVVHVTHENEVVIIDDVTIGADGSVTFETDGFSPVGVATPLGAGNDDGEAAWSVDDKGVLTIRDQSALDFSAGVPWANSETEITTVVFEDGVTSIPDNFASKAGLTGVTSVTLAESVAKVGGSAFANCADLEKINLDRVAEIGDSAFKGCASLEKIRLDSAEKIGKSAFDGCASIADVTLSGALESIGESAFANCESLETATFSRDNMMTELPKGLFAGCTSLTKATLPEDLKDIPDNLFKDCASLETVTMPIGLDTIGKDAFNGCASLEKLELPDGLLGIGDRAFKGCASLQKADFPDSVKSLGSETYRGCASLSEVELPAALETVGGDAFRDCSGIEYVDMEDTALTALSDNMFRACASLAEVRLPQGLKKIGNSAFNSCGALETAALPDGLEEIGDSAFSQCASLTRLGSGAEAGVIRLPETLTKVGTSAFQGCNGFVDVEIPDAVTQLGASALANCANLTRAVIGEGVTTIDKSLFYQDAKLEYVEFKGRPSEIPDNTFQGCTSLKEFPLWEGLVRIGNSAFSGCTGLTRMDFPSTLTTIGNYAFNNCSNIQELALPEGLETIGNYAFYNLNKVQTLALPETLKSIGSRAFYNNTALTDVTFPTGDQLTTIGSYAFYGCSKLTKALMPDSVTSLGSYAFQSCTSLNEAHIPSGLTALNDGIFYGCSSLPAIELPPALKTIGGYVFRGCSSLANVDLPDTLTNIGTYAFYGCSAFTSLDMPDSVTSLGSYAYSYCSNLVEARLSDGLTYIPQQAFSNCTKLKEITFPKNLTRFSGSSSFYNCTSLEEVTLPDSLTTFASSTFSGCTSLKKVNIPVSTSMSTSTSILYNCRSLEELRWEAANGSIGSFTSNTHFPVTVASTVNNISQTALTNLVNGGAEMLVFESNSSLTLPSTAGMNLPRPLNNLAAGTYCADEFGVLYQVVNGEATLVYLPDGLESYTIPAAVHGYPVKGVKNSALYLAQALKELTIEDPGALTAIDDYAFAYARNLEKVNGETTLEGATALFNKGTYGAQIFCDTKLDTLPSSQDGSLVYSHEEGDAKWTGNVQVTISQEGSTMRREPSGENPKEQSDPQLFRDPDTNAFMVYTGETVKTNISITNPDSALISPGDKIRIYFQTDEGATLTPTFGKSESTILKNQNGHTLACGFFETSVKGVYYVEMDRPTNGDTFSPQVEILYPNKTTAGGNVLVWVDYIPADQVESTRKKPGQPTAKNHLINSITRRNDYPVKKQGANQDSEALKVSVAEQNGVSKAFVEEHSYNISMNIAEDANSIDVGKDYVTQAEYVDTLHLPEGVVVNDVVLQEIRDGKITYSTSRVYESAVSGYVTYKYIKSPTSGNIFTFRTQNNPDSYQTPTLSLTEDGELQLKWTVVNGNPNYNGNAAEIATPDVRVTLGNRLLCVTGTETDKEYTLVNHVDQTLSYCYSEPVAHADEGEYTVNSGSARYTVSKTGVSGKRGEDAPYTITIPSTGILPVDTAVISDIDDEIGDRDVDDTTSGTTNAHYIKPENIWKMFTDEMYSGVKGMGNGLTLEITNIRLFDNPVKGTKSVITTAKDVTTAYTDYVNTGYDTPYDDTTSASDTHSNHETTANLTFRMEGGKLCYTLVSGGETLADSVIDSEDAMKAMFADRGILVAANTHYHVHWDTTKVPDFSIPGGTTLTITIPTTYKDSFMLLSADRPYYEYQYSRTVLNTVYVNKGDTDRQRKAHAQNYNENDWSLSKGASFVDTHHVTGETYDFDVPDVMKYTVSARHYGKNRYPLMPVTDHMSQKQILMVPVTGNETLAELGLETYTCQADGQEYYLLNQTGTYENVWTGEHRADHVDVTANANGTYDTTIFWYLTDVGGNTTSTINYKARILQNPAVTGTYAYNYNNRSWLGDHFTRRLYATVNSNGGYYAAEPMLTYWDKKIVDFVGDKGPGRTYEGITEGKTIVYRLTLGNSRNPRFVITADTLRDYLPLSVSSYRWALGTNVKLDYEGLSLSGSAPTLGTGSSPQYIRWNNATLTCTNDDGIAYIYVTLTFPSGTAWDAYLRSYGNTTLNNDLRVVVNGTTYHSYVYHDLFDTGEARLQKGVYDTGAWDEVNQKNIYRSGENARLRYENNDSLKRKVYYYITLHNGGATRMYLNEIQDVLPKGFTLCGTPTIATSSYAHVTPTPSSYVSSSYLTLSCPAAETLDDGRQRVRMNLVAQPGYESDKQNNPTRFQYSPYLEKYYLMPGQALVIRLECWTNEYSDTNQTARNYAAMPYCDWLGQGLTLSDSESTVNAAGKKTNDGGCDIVDTSYVSALGFDTAGQNAATEWMLSDVALTRGDIRPGLDKTLWKRYIEDDGQVTVVDYPSSVRLFDKLLWGIRLRNDGDSAISDYAVTDVLPDPFNFTGEVYFGLAFNASEAEKLGSIENMQKLFTIHRDVEENGTETTVLPTMTFTAANTVPYTIGDPAVELQLTGKWAGCKALVKLDRNEDGNEVLSVRFTDKAMGLPAGGMVKLAVGTQNLRGGNENHVYINCAYLTPLGRPWEELPNVGSKVDYRTPYSDAMVNSVRGSAPVTASFGGSTSSIKHIEEKLAPANTTHSDAADNTITVRDKTRTVTYRLCVVNENTPPMDRVVLIDNLPMSGDHTTFQADDARNSAFRVLLAEQPDFRLVVKTQDGTETVVPADKYRVEYSGKTEFGKDDWKGTASDDWTAYTGGVLTQEQLQGIRSVRLVFNDSAEKVTDYLVQDKSSLWFSFDARADQEDDGVQPGAVAWNSFGYHYGLWGRTEDLEAAPLVVGLRIPELPKLTKSLVNARGKEYIAKRDATFRYIMYEGTAISGLPGSLTEEQIIKAIEGAKRSYVPATVTVCAGASASEAAFSFDDAPARMYENGAYLEDAVWTMDDGHWYNLVELPGDADYESYRYNGSKTASFRFQYNAKGSRLEIESVNMHQDWSLKLEKRDQNGNPVKGAVFAVYTQVENEALEGLDELTLDALNERFGSGLTDEALKERFGEEYTLSMLKHQKVEDNGTDYRLMALFTTNAMGEAQLDALMGADYLCTELQAPQYYTLNTDVVKVARKSGTNEVVSFRVEDVHYIASGKVYVDANKVLTGGRPLKAGEFTFAIDGFDIQTRQVFASGAAGEPPMPEARTASNDKDGNIAFGPVAMDTGDIGKVYYYRIAEVIPEAEADRVKDVKYDGTAFIVKATVVDNGDGTLDLDTEAFTLDDKQTLVSVKPADYAFVNRYEQQTEITIPVAKNLIDREWKDSDSFTFELVSRDENGAETVLKSLTLDKDHPSGTISRGYTQEDVDHTYTYALRERIPDGAVGFNASGKKVRVPKTLQSAGKVDLTYAKYREIVAAKQLEAYGLSGMALTWRVDGLIYDSTEHAIEVQVTYDEALEGLKATANGKVEPDTQTFDNSFTTESTSARLTVTKRVDGRPWLRPAEETYRFRIDNLENAPLPIVDGVKTDEIAVKRGRNTEAAEQSGSVDIAYEWADLRQADGTHAARKAFTYVLTEIVPDDARAIMDGDRVVGYMRNQIHYDLSSRTVRVWLIDNGDGTIGTEVEYLTPDADPAKAESWTGAATAFVNTYEKETELTVFPLSVTKRINRAAADHGVYTFTLYDAEGAVVNDALTLDAEEVENGRLSLNLTLTDAQKIDCTGIDVDHPKTVEYTLRENIPTDAMGFSATGEPLNVKYADATAGQKASTELIWKLDGVNYDSSAIPVHVTVSLDKLTYLMKPTVTYGAGRGDTAIVDNYEPTPVDLSLGIGKQILGKDGTTVLETWAQDAQDWTDMRFQFKLEAKDAGSTPMPAEAGRTATADDEHRTAQFGAIRYAEEGVYEYRISEVMPSEDGDPYSLERHLLYDESVHTVKVTIRDNLQGKMVVASIVYDGDADNGQPVYNNRYIEDPFYFRKVNEAGAALAGATLALYEANGTTPVGESWVSSAAEDHPIYDLHRGRQYVLKETQAPVGYLPMADQRFRVLTDGSIQADGDAVTTAADDRGLVVKVRNAPVQVSFAKVDPDGARIPGAVLKLEDSRGQVVDSWTSDANVHTISRLVIGQTYTLTETLAPAGHKGRAVVAFHVDETGSVIVETLDADGAPLDVVGTDSGLPCVSVENPPVVLKVRKLAPSGNAVRSAKMALLDADGKTLDSWTTDGSDHTLPALANNQSYTIRETEAPDGFIVAPDLHFMLDSFGEITAYRLDAKGSRIAVAPGADEGALVFTVTDEKTKVSVSGTKTWLDGRNTHVSKDEVALTLKRTPAGGSEEPVDASPAWTGDTYTYANLDEYDDLSRKYTYTVTEADITGFATSYDVKGYTQNITNLRVGKVEVSGEKTWLDGGKAHVSKDEITLTLKRTSAKAGSKPETLDVKPVWTGNRYSYANLDEFDREGYPYTYAVEEKAIEGFTTDVDDSTLNTVNFTNLRTGKVEVSGDKTWLDGENAHVSADEITLALKRVSAKEGSTAETLDVKPVWTNDHYSYANLDEFDREGYLYTYTVEEAKIEGFDTTVDDSEPNAFDFTNLRVGKVEVVGEKTWLDGGKAHNSKNEITLTLKRTSAKEGSEPETVGVKPVWTDDRYSYADLDEFDPEGYPYTYTVEEAEIEGFTTDVDDSEPNAFDFTNLRTGKVEVSGEKTWVDGYNAHVSEDEVKLTLKRVSAKEGSEPEIVDVKPAWDGDHYSYADLDEFDPEGYPYAYAVEETPIEGYDTAVDDTVPNAFDFTNTRVGKVEVSGEKTWLDGENAHVSADEITLTLKRTSAKEGSEPQTLDIAPVWTDDHYSYADLDEFDPEGYLYTYVVEETEIEGFTTAVDDTTLNTYDFTNLRTGKVEVSGEKTWVDGANTHVSADEVKLTLKRVSAREGSEAETVDVKPAWDGDRYSYANLDEFDPEGYPYTYAVEETPIEGYDTAVDDSMPNAFDFTNTRVGKVEVSGDKTWLDGENAHVSANEVKLTLKRVSAKEGSEPETLDAKPVWDGDHYSYADLDGFDPEGYPYTYTVEEAEIEGFATTVDDTTLNTYDFANLRVGKVDISGTKTWIDGGRAHDNAAEVKLTLIRTSAKQGAQPERLQSVPTWAENRYTFADLDRYDAEGYEYAYSVEEVPVTAYEIHQDGLDFTNTYRASGSVTLAATKVLTGRALEAGEFSFQLKDSSGRVLQTAKNLASGEVRFEPIDYTDADLANSPLTYTISEVKGSAEYVTYADNTETVKVTLADDGEGHITATADRDAVQVRFENAYVTPEPTAKPTATPAGGPTPTPAPRIDVEGVKVWNDEDNIHRTRPDSVVIELLADGEVADSRTVSGSGDSWPYKFSSLPELDAEGRAIAYTVREKPVERYRSVASGYTITNTLIPSRPEKYVELKGEKTWRDNDDAEGRRPASITVRLYRDGEVAAVCTTSEEDGWKYSFGRLPADDGYGNVYTYKLREDGVEGYFARIDGMNVTNTRITDFEMSGLVPKSSTPLSRLASLTEAEMDGLMDVLGYGTPLFGMLDTGDETPLYPFLFGGAGLLALAMLLALRKRRGR